MFQNCTSLTSITLPSNLNINAFAFADCTSLTSITFQGTPTNIDEYAFGACENLTINVPWIEGTVSGAPWGAENSTVIYGS